MLPRDPCVVCVHDCARTVEREVSRRFLDLHQSNVLPASRRKELRSGAKRAQVLRLESDSKSNNYWNRTLLYTVAYVQRGSWLVVVQAARSRALELLRLRESVELRPVRVEHALKNILGDADVRSKSAPLSHIYRREEGLRGGRRGRPRSLFARLSCIRPYGFNYNSIRRRGAG